jgi:hypothetical protein
MSAQAFVDESGRGSHYHVCAVVVANADVDDLRRLVRSFCLPGQRRWHFVHERDSRRKRITDALTAKSQVSAVIFHAKGPESTIRAESFRRMVSPLLARNVTRLIIESPKAAITSTDKCCSTSCAIARWRSAMTTCQHTAIHYCGSPTPSPGVPQPAEPGENASTR